MDQPDDGRDVTLYGNGLKRYWRPLAIFALLGAWVAVVALHLVPARYTAHAAVLVQPTGTSSASAAVVGGRTSTPVNLDTEAQLVKSSPVAAVVKKELGWSGTLAALESKVAISVPANSSIMVISYTAGSPEQAAAGAQDFARAYLANRLASAKADLALQASAYSKQIANLRNELKQVTQRLSSESTSSSSRASDEALKSSLPDQINNLTTALDQTATTAVTPGVITVGAVAPARPSGPSRGLYLSSGVMLGLLVGLLCCAVQAASDKRIKSARQLAGSGVEVLASLPRNTPPNAFLPGNVAATRAVQQLGRLLGKHLYPPASMAILGVETDVSVVASSLAIDLARTDLRVVLVCAGERARSTATFLGARDDYGLSDVLRGDIPVAAALQEPAIQPGVFALGPGIDPDIDSAGAPAFTRLLHELRTQFDVVLIQCPQLDEASDATGQILASVADGVLLVATVNRTHQPLFDETVQFLGRVGARVLGAVTIMGGHRRVSKKAARASQGEPPVSTMRTVSAGFVTDYLPSGRGSTGDVKGLAKVRSRDGIDTAEDTRRYSDELTRRYSEQDDLGWPPREAVQDTPGSSAGSSRA